MRYERLIAAAVSYPSFHRQHIGNTKPFAVLGSCVGQPLSFIAAKLGHIDLLAQFRRHTPARVRGSGIASARVGNGAIARNGYRSVGSVLQGQIADIVLSPWVHDPNVACVQPQLVIYTKGSNGPSFTGGVLWGTQSDRTSRPKPFGSQLLKI